MNLQRFTCLSILLLSVSTIVTQSAQAQYLGSGLFGQGMMARGNLGAFTRSNFGNNFGGRNFRGNANIIPPPTFHEFARTIPRPFENSILPFYALYPPVYYSYVVPRPYGFSPFALPAGKAPAEALVRGPANSAEIVNPHYRPDAEAGEAAAEPTGLKSASVIINRHVRANHAAGQQKSNSADSRPTKLIINPFVNQPKVAVQQHGVQR